MKETNDKSKILPRSFSIRRIKPGIVERSIDLVAPEEPLDIRISYWLKDAPFTAGLALTMRTPGNERELTAGLLLAEGVIAKASDIRGIRFLGSGNQNEILAELAPHVDVETWRLRRSSVLNSSCGICGKVSRDQIAPSFPNATDPAQISSALILALPSLLRSHQQGFALTGALHAAALVDQDGTVEQVFEDVGRHNALDKVLGWCLLNDRLPVGNRILFLSSRGSFELVQKTAMAAGAILATVGGPSSLAIETARSLGITLVGFVRNNRCNVYSGEWRIDSK